MAAARGSDVERSEPRSGDRRHSWRTVLCRPIRGSLFFLPCSHGSRRGLGSSATPWLRRGRLKTLLFFYSVLITPACRTKKPPYWDKLYLSHRSTLECALSQSKSVVGDAGNVPPTPPLIGGRTVPVGPVPT